MKKIFLTGSCAFFSCLADFKPKDIDWIVLDSEPRGYRFLKQTILPGKCIFEVKDMPAEEMVTRTLFNREPPMQMIKFLTPDFAQHIGLTIEQLERLQPLVEKLDPKHRYAEIIYNSYIANGSFSLTESQRNAAFKCYQEARP